MNDEDNNKTGALDSITERFERITEKDMMKGFLILLVIASLSTASRYIGLSNMPVNASRPGGLSSIIIAMGFIQTFLGFTISVGIIYGVSRLLGGDGGFKRMFTLGAYAQIPMILQELLVIVDALFFTASNTPLPGESSAIGVALTGITLFSLLTLGLITIAVKANSGLPWGRSLIAASTPTLLIMAIRIAMGGIGIGSGMRLPIPGMRGGRPG
ncbi:MAG: YIP1 family protein [Candidatus Bathyarchaeota archaeon]|nr:YIP1 family protein [Candidatus Bathyarchaeota archaeon]